MSTVLPELGRKFRYTMVRIAEQLTDSECESIIFAERIPPQYVESQSNKRLAVLSRLEAEGHFSPLKPEGLSALLKEINRCDLQDQVTEYTSSREYKLAKESEKKRLKTVRKDKRDPQKYPREVDERQMELIRELKVAYDPMSLPKNAFAATLTHVGLLAQVELVRETIFNTIPSDTDPELRREKAIQAIQEVEEGVEKVANSLRKALSVVVKSSSSSGTEDPEENYDHLPASMPSTPQDSPVSSPNIRRRLFAVPGSPQLEARLAATHRWKREEKINEKPSTNPTKRSGSGKYGQEESPSLSNRQKMVYPKVAGRDAPDSPLQLQKTIAQACAERRRSRSESDPQHDAGSPHMATKGRRGSVPDKTPPLTPQLPIHKHGPYRQEEAEMVATVSSADNTGHSSTDNTADSGYAELKSWQGYPVNSTRLSELDPHASVAEDSHSYASLKTDNRAEEAIYDEPVTPKQAPKK